MASNTRNLLCFAAALTLGLNPAVAQAPVPRAGGPANSASVQPQAVKAPAASNHDAREGRLQGMTKAELEALEPYLQAGPVALAEFTGQDKEALPAINVAAIVHAPPAAVMALLQKPEAYPAFMHTMDEVSVVQKAGSSTVYDWRWRVAIFTMHGRNAMSVLSPPPDRQDAGYRVTIDSLSGDLGTGRMSIRVLPHGERESTVVISMRIDLRNANYVARQIAKAARSMNRTANMSLATAMLLSLRHEAERRVGYVAPPRAAVPLRKPAFAVQAALSLLTRGDLVLLDMSGDRLNQVATFGLIMRDRELVREVLLDADSFGAALVPGSTSKVVTRQGALTTFDWDVDLPLVGVSGRMTMRDGAVVAVEAIEGALRGGRWHFETQRLSDGATLLANWASFDVRDSTWFVRKLAESDPYLGHGMTAAGEVMLVRALRTQAGKRAEQRAAAAVAAAATRAAASP
jgi:carbon monoxide dehydrogenase subunit G